MLYLLIASFVFVAFSGKQVLAQEQGASLGAGQVLGYGEVQNIRPAEQRSKVTSLSGKVLIELKIIHYSKVASRNLKGEQVVREIERVPESFRLNANLESPQVFHVSGYKVEINPVAWNRHAGQYKFGLRLNRLFGDYQQLEEFVGETTIEGNLVQVSDSKFSLRTSADLLFKDKSNDPLVRLVIGSEGADTLAKGSRMQGSSSRLQ